MQTLELVIFDCDGVLVDSERLANEVFRGLLLERCGIALSLEQMFDRFVGKSTQQCMDIIEEMLGRAPPQGLDVLYQERINAALAAEVEMVPGIEQVLNALSIPACVASSGSHEKMRTTLGKTGLLTRFAGLIYSCSDVAHAKPAPDIYLHAAAVMGSTPSRCLVIEDSATGVTGARAAGMTVFGFAQLTPASRLQAAGAQLCFTEMQQLTGLINEYQMDVAHGD